MAKKNNNQVSAVRQAKRFPLAGINLFMVLNVHSVAG